MNDNYKYGTLIAKLMGDRISPQEEKQLDEWVCASDENMKLFESLINEYKARWAKRWFAEAGVNTRFIKWKKMDGWYKPEHHRLRNFYIMVVLGFVMMIGVYLLLRYT